MRLVRLLALVAALAGGGGPASAAAQDADPSRLSVARIHASADFRPQAFGPARWIDGGAAYTTVERTADGRGQEIIRYESATGARQVLVPASALTPPGGPPLEVEDYAWSPDQRRLLVFTASRQVWRTNTRGDYWVLDRDTGRLRRLGGADAAPSTLMFAKFSPDGGRVGYVRANDLHVEDLATGAITRLTADGSRTRINGTFDWVYEEELGLRDGWRWSPDGATVAYWQLDAEGVRDFALINNTDSLYAQVIPIQYPKAGERNSAARIGLVPAAGGATRWLAFEGDPREHYLARLAWTPDGQAVAVQRLNRLQNTLTVWLADRQTLALTPVLVERDSAWVDVVDEWQWLAGGREFLWSSEREGWRQLWVVARDGRRQRVVTPGRADVLAVHGVDERGGWVYYSASPDDPARRYLWRARLDGRGRPERLTPAGYVGTNTYDVAPGGAVAWHTFSNVTTPPTRTLVALPGHAAVRTVVDNAPLKARVAALARGPMEFLDIPVDGRTLKAWVIKPPAFDSTRAYPLLLFVYGGPGSQTVLDSWGARDLLWHLYLAQKGYVVASVDNRGTGARGRDFRKVIYGRLGVVETEDQAAAARWFGARRWVDAARIGIWGWSYGGFMALNGLLQAPDAFRAAIAVAPVTHWKFYDNIYTERYNGLPRDNAEGYDRGSPLSYAGNLRGHLLLVHGTGDDNVHLQNSEAMADALVAANKPFQYMAYPNRNHAIAGGTTRRHLYELMERFLDERLRPSPPGGTP